MNREEVMKGIKPDPVLVFEAERIVSAANVHRIHMGLAWYTYWCSQNKQYTAAVSAKLLRLEIAEARESQREARRIIKEMERQRESA